MHKRLTAAALMALALGGSAGAADQPPRLSVTIYNGDLALVQDQRSIEVPAGRTRLEFKDVSSEIQPETATLSAPGVAIVEQNFDFDLLTPDKMMQKAVGQQVRIVRTNPGNGEQVTETALVLAVNDGVVLKIGDRIEVLRDDGVPTRVLFDKVPDNLRARPTLSVTVDSSKAGPRTATLTYLTRGLTWKADYVALFDEQAGRMDMQGWITLTNTSGVAFNDARTQLVAGRASTMSQPAYGGYGGGGNMTAGGRQSGAAGKALGDYYLYPLSEPTTIAQNQTKQVSFLDVKGVTARKIYRYYVGSFSSLQTPDHAQTALEFTNGMAGGLGAQLPEGMVRIYVRDDRGNPTFVGENRIGHTPQGSQVATPIGEAFDVTIQPTLVSAGQPDKDHTRYEMRYVVRNAKSGPVTLSLLQSVPAVSKLEKESQEGRRLGAQTLAWDLSVPGNGETVLTFTVLVGP